MNNLRGLDLNLLVTLDVLLSEHNVTRAAKRLNFSQPSVSAHLAKLREIFKDPLLLPGPRGMRPTQRADELREPLRQALKALECAVVPAGPFDPAKANQTWRIAASDYGELTVLLPIMKELRLSAPRTRLAVFEKAPSRILRQMEQGNIDLAFHTRDEAPPELRLRILFAEHYVLASRIGHPGLKKRSTLDEFCKLEHVIVSPDGGGFLGITDSILAKAALTRKVVLSVPHFLFVPSVLESTDLVAILPSRLVKGCKSLQIMAPPIEIPGYEMAMLWHERSHRDPAHQWLRELVTRSVSMT